MGESVDPEGEGVASQLLHKETLPKPFFSFPSRRTGKDNPELKELVKANWELARSLF